MAVANQWTGFYMIGTSVMNVKGYLLFKNEKFETAFSDAQFKGFISWNSQIPL